MVMTDEKQVMRLTFSNDIIKSSDKYHHYVEKNLTGDRGHYLAGYVLSVYLYVFHNVWMELVEIPLLISFRTISILIS